MNEIQKIIFFYASFLNFLKTEIRILILEIYRNVFAIFKKERKYDN